MSISVFDHPWLSGHFADADMAALWSSDAQLAHMRAFEAAWSRGLETVGLVPASEGDAAATAIEAASLDMEDLREGTARDGVPVPALVRQLRRAGGDAVHHGATSQDVIDTSLALTMQASVALLEDRLTQLEVALRGVEDRFGDAALMGRTRMQAATEMTVRDRVLAWRLPIADHRARLASLRPRIERVQIGGASGDRAALGGHGDRIVAFVAEALGLVPADKAWHGMRDGVGEFASVLSLISGTLGKLGQDVALMAQQGVDEITLSGGGGSSAMPDKQNPILAELLVTLARYNAVQISGLHQALIHEQERSGAAWALEWMILPGMAQTTGRSLTAGLALIGSIERIGTPATQS